MPAREWRVPAVRAHFFSERHLPIPLEEVLGNSRLAPVAENDLSGK
jgi:hypothetical protein